MPPKTRRSSNPPVSGTPFFALVDRRPPGGGASHPWVFRFTVRDVDVSVVNAIRRIILSRVPTVGFHFDTDTSSSTDIRMIANTSSLHNEFVVHRLSLLPLHYTAEEVARHTKGSVELDLDVTNDTPDSIDVTTKDMVVTDGTGAPVSPEEQRRVLPPCPLTGDWPLILRLKPGQRLAFHATPSVGTASEYAGRSAVSLCSYGYERPDSISFSIESECGVDPAWMVPFALRTLAGDVARARRNLGTPVLPSASTFQWDISDADHTLGSVVQGFAHGKVAYVGYHCPHPLQRVVRLVVRWSDDPSASDASDRLGSILQELEDQLTSITPAEDWAAES